jgi:hypothetical protein
MWFNVDSEQTMSKTTNAEQSSCVALHGDNKCIKQSETGDWELRNVISLVSDTVSISAKHAKCQHILLGINHLNI